MQRNPVRTVAQNLGNMYAVTATFFPLIQAVVSALQYLVKTLIALKQRGNTNTDGNSATIAIAVDIRLRHDFANAFSNLAGTIDSGFWTAERKS